MRTALLASTAIALIAGPATPSLAAKPPKPAPATLTAAASKTLLTFGAYTTLSGALSSKAVGVAVTLEAQAFPFTGRFADVMTSATTTDGAYSFTTLPGANTKYRVVAKTKPDTTSPEVGVQVRWHVGLSVGDTTPARGKRIRFSGSVKPPNPNAVVYVQRLTGSGWKTIRQTKLTTGTTTSSSYSVRVKILRSGRYRTAVLGDGTHETGVSRSRKLTVH